MGSFKGKNFLWHLAAWVLTAVIVISGFDWFYYSHVLNSDLSPLFFPAIFIGMFVPMICLPICIIWNWAKKKGSAKIKSWALAQAALVGYLVSIFYKALTGRIHPPRILALDTSRQFNFGFFKEGIFWGWPSSHTTVAFAMAFAMMALYPKSKLIKILSIIYALYIGIGVTFEIHWFSEFVAGAIIGAVVGSVVGKSFEKKFDLI